MSTFGFSDSNFLGPVTRRHFCDIQKPVVFFEDGERHIRDQAFSQLQILMVSWSLNL